MCVRVRACVCFFSLSLWDCDFHGNLSLAKSDELSAFAFEVKEIFDRASVDFFGALSSVSRCAVRTVRTCSHAVRAEQCQSCRAPYSTVLCTRMMQTSAALQHSSFFSRVRESLR